MKVEIIFSILFCALSFTLYKVYTFYHKSRKDGLATRESREWEITDTYIGREDCLVKMQVSISFSKNHPHDRQVSFSISNIHNHHHHYRPHHHHQAGQLWSPGQKVRSCSGRGDESSPQNPHHHRELFPPGGRVSQESILYNTL